MLLIWEFDYVKNLITSYELLNKINYIKLYKTQLSIIIYSTADQLKYVLQYCIYYCETLIKQNNFLICIIYF